MESSFFPLGFDIPKRCNLILQGSLKINNIAEEDFNLASGLGNLLPMPGLGAFSNQPEVNNSTEDGNTHKIATVKRAQTLAARKTSGPQKFWESLRGKKANKENQQAEKGNCKECEISVENLSENSEIENRNEGSSAENLPQDSKNYDTEKTGVKVCKLVL